MIVFPLFSIYIFFCPEKIEKKKKITPYRFEVNELSDNKNSTDKRNTV